MTSGPEVRIGLLLADHSTNKSGQQVTPEQPSERENYKSKEERFGQSSSCIDNPNSPQKGFEVSAEEAAEFQDVEESETFLTNPGCASVLSFSGKVHEGCQADSESDNTGISGQLPIERLETLPKANEQLCSIEQLETTNEKACFILPRDDMVNLERAKVFKDSLDNDDCFVEDRASESCTDGEKSDDSVFEPEKGLSTLPAPVLNPRRRHCSEGEGAVKEKVGRYRNQSVTDEDLEKVIGKAAWLVALADHSDKSLIRSYHAGVDYFNAENLRVPAGLGSLDTGLNLSAIATTADMKGWGIGSQGNRLNMSPGRTNSCGTSPVKSSPAPKPLNKYAAILASVGCAPTGLATCPLALLSGTNRKVVLPSNSDASSTVTWSHHTCCSPAVATSATTAVTCTSASTATTTAAKLAPDSPCEPASPGSTKGIGNKSCSINLKTFSASFNCRAAVGKPAAASSPMPESPNKTIMPPVASIAPSLVPQPVGVVDERTKGTRLKISSAEGSPVKSHRTPECVAVKPSSPKTPSKSPRSNSGVALVKTSLSSSGKTSPKTGRSRGDGSTRSKKSSKNNAKHAVSSSSSKSSSSSSVATIECESISVTIPDRPMCVMTSSYTPDSEVGTPDSMSGDRLLPNQNEAFAMVGGNSAMTGVGRAHETTWRTRQSDAEYRLDNVSVTYDAAILHSDSLSSEADEENNRTVDANPASILRQRTITSDVSEDATTTNDEDDTDSTMSALSKTALLSSRRRHRQRPLSLPSNHQLDLKLCYFNPDADDPDPLESSVRSRQRSRVDLDLDLGRSAKRHSTGHSQFDQDRWHSALHPLIHSQSQILEGNDLSRVAKVKILSKTSWCDCSQEFLTTLQNKRHTCPRSPCSPKDNAVSLTSLPNAVTSEEDGVRRQKCCGNAECRGCHGDDRVVGMETEEEEMRIPKAPSDEFLTEAMKFTREKLRHRSGEDLVTLLEQFYKQIQSVSEELVVLLQERHDLHEQVDMRKIAIEQLVRLQNEAAASNDVTSIQMSVILPGTRRNRDNHR